MAYQPEVTPVGTLLDPFLRMRVSNPKTVFDSKLIFDNQPQFWDDQEVSGAGTTSTYVRAEAGTTLAVAGATAGRRVRQTRMRHNYQPGKGQLIIMTGVLTRSGVGPGNEFGLGLGDDANGIFYRNKDGVMQLLIRSGATGGTVEEVVAQVDWNVDGFGIAGNPRNPSGVTLDPTMELIYFFDFEWLGVGAVRMGFVINNRLHYAHRFLHSNLVSLVYMSTPNLPLRYWIENGGTGPAATLTHNCSTVISEGGADDTGTLHSQSTSRNAVAGAVPFIQANTIGTAYAVCGLRLKAVASGAAIDTLDGAVAGSMVSMISGTNDDYEWGLSFNPTINAGGLTWVDEANSVVQFGVGDTAGNPSATTLVAIGQKIAGGFVKSGGNAGSFAQMIESARRLGSSIAGVPDEVVLWVRPLAVNANIRGALDWRELS